MRGEKQGKDGFINAILEGGGKGDLERTHSNTCTHTGVLIHGRTAGCPIWRLPLQSRCRIPSLFWIRISLLNPPSKKKRNLQEFSPREGGGGGDGGVILGWNWTVGFVHRLGTINDYAGPRFIKLTAFQHLPRLAFRSMSMEEQTV